MTSTTIIVIGAGPAGMMAAYTAASAGVGVLLLERNQRLGRKLALTGAGRCNLTNQTDLEELVANLPGNGRFLYSALRNFGPADLMAFFQEQLRVPLKVERGRRVFPVSDQAVEIVAALKTGLQQVGVVIQTKTRVAGLSLTPAGQISSLRTTTGKELAAAAVIVATGGLSYPATGSSGDGYQLATAVGHTVRPLWPSLVPLETKEPWVQRLEGLSLINVQASCFQGPKRLAREFGELLFTGFGISGPLVLTISRQLVPLLLAQPDSVRLELDLKPALTEAELDRRVQRDWAELLRKQYQNSLAGLLPRKLIPIMVELSGIEPERPVHEITKLERLRLVRLLKGLPLTLSRPRPLAEAIVTVGGVATTELNPQTMESKLVAGLYFAGEVVDVDGYTGGYNLQAAFAMGYAAGKAAAARVQQA